MKMIMVTTMLLLLITSIFVLQMSSQNTVGLEFFMNHSNENKLTSSLAPLNQSLLLSDVLAVETGLTDTDAKTCAFDDASRGFELGGDYEQRTNNYRRSYPDSCSSLISEFVGGFYAPKIGGVGQEAC